MYDVWLENTSRQVPPGRERYGRYGTGNYWKREVSSSQLRVSIKLSGPI